MLSHFWSDFFVDMRAVCLGGRFVTRSWNSAGNGDGGEGSDGEGFGDFEDLEASGVDTAQASQGTDAGSDDGSDHASDSDGSGGSDGEDDDAAALRAKKGVQLISRCPTFLQSRAIFQKPQRSSVTLWPTEPAGCVHTHHFNRGKRTSVLSLTYIGADNNAMRGGLSLWRRAAALKKSFNSEYDGDGGKPARGPVEEKMPESYYDQMKKDMLQRQVCSPMGSGHFL
jgi:hypothetical protein